MEEVEIKPEQQTKRNVCYVFYILDAQDSGLFKKQTEKKTYIKQ